MKEVLIQPLLQAVSALNAMQAAFELDGGLRSVERHADGSATVAFVDDPVMLHVLTQNAQELSSGCRELTAKVTLAALDEFRQSLLPDNRKFLTYEDIHRKLVEINAIFRFELASIKVLSVSASEQELYEKDGLFGPKVDLVFRVAADDIRDAGTCLALSRGTAAVFHLMRVMEAGLKALASELGVPYAPSWESYITQLNRLLDSKNYDGLTDDQKVKRPFYQDVLGDLTSVKSAWRNPTMHIVRRYDAVEARRVFYAVEGFMQHLAANLVTPA